MPLANPVDNLKGLNRLSLRVSSDRRLCRFATIWLILVARMRHI